MACCRKSEEEVIGTEGKGIRFERFEMGADGALVLSVFDIETRGVKQSAQLHGADAVFRFVRTAGGSVVEYRHNDARKSHQGTVFDEPFREPPVLSVATGCRCATSRNHPSRSPRL